MNETLLLVLVSLIDFVVMNTDNNLSVQEEGSSIEGNVRKIMSRFDVPFKNPTDTFMIIYVINHEFRPIYWYMCMHS